MGLNNDEVKTNKLGFIRLYRQENIYFTGNPNYTLFGYPLSYNNHNNLDNNLVSEYITNNFSKKYRHTHFYTDTDKIMINTKTNELNLNYLYYDVIYDLILETKVVPSNIILNIYNNYYNFEITKSIL